jgi:hypothetical protein
LLRDRCDLRRGLAEAQNDLGESLPNGAMVVDACEPDVLERLSPECLDQLPQSLRRIRVAPGDPIEQIFEQFV